MAVLETIKKAARISGDHLDDEITRLISVADSELVRAGCDEEVIKKGGSLVTQAVITYVLSQLSEDATMAARYDASFQTQLDAVRRSSNVQ